MRTNSESGRRPMDPGELLFGSARGRLLAWLYGHPDERFYLRELVRNTGAAQGSVQRELRLLSDAGLIERSAEGRQVYFQANRDSSIFRELQQLLVKTRGVANVVSQALMPLKPSISAAFIFGSAAKGALRASSDIDLLIVGTVSLHRTVSALGPAQDFIGREINPSIHTPEEFARKLQKEDHFLSTILSEPKVFIIGTDDDLVRLGEKRLADAAQKQRPRDRRPAGRRRA